MIEDDATDRQRHALMAWGVSEQDARAPLSKASASRWIDELIRLGRDRSAAQRPRSDLFVRPPPARLRAEREVPTAAEQERVRLMMELGTMFAHSDGTETERLENDVEYWCWKHRVANPDAIPLNKPEMLRDLVRYVSSSHLARRAADGSE